MPPRPPPPQVRGDDGRTVLVEDLQQPVTHIQPRNLACRVVTDGGMDEVGAEGQNQRPRGHFVCSSRSVVLPTRAGVCWSLMAEYKGTWQHGITGG